MPIGLTTRCSVPDRLAAAAILSIAFLVGASNRGQAQVGIGADITTDATVAPEGIVRIRAFTEWTRYDALFGVPGTSGPQQLGTLFSSPSLGSSQVPLLAPTEANVQSLTGSPSVNVSLGQLTTVANVRVMTAPILIEYGLTRHLTLSVSLPWCRPGPTSSRSSIRLARRAPTSARTPPRSSTTQPRTRRMNRSLPRSRRPRRSSAANWRLVKQRHPAPDVRPFLTQQTQANALVQLSTTFATSAGALYGVSTAQPGQPFIPIANGTIEQAIDARVDSIRTAFASYGVSAGTGSLTAAGGPAAFQQLQQLVSDPSFGINRYTTGTASHLSLGDIELGATYQMVNTFTDSSAPGWQRRIALARRRAPSDGSARARQQAV